MNRTITLVESSIEVGPKHVFLLVSLMDCLWCEVLAKGCVNLSCKMLRPNLSRLIFVFHFHKPVCLQAFTGTSTLRNPVVGVSAQTTRNTFKHLTSNNLQRLTKPYKAALKKDMKQP